MKNSHLWYEWYDMSEPDIKPFASHQVIKKSIQNISGYIV